jgi:hypothetical protein
MNMYFKQIFLFRLFILAVLFSSCDSSDNEPGKPVDPAEAEEGYATGKITDTNGNPIAGAKVVIDNTMFYNSNIITTSKMDGSYKEKLPTLGTYNVTATVVKELHGIRYTLDLHPENSEILSNAGGVRNFQLKLTGKKPDDLGYYGGTIGINAAVGSNIYDSENIEFTLEPVGNLIDGSPGQTLVVREGAAYTPEYGYLVDIPLGRYKMKAMYIKGDNAVPLKIRKKFDATSVYATSFLLNFDAETNSGRNMAIIEYSE